MLIEKGGQIIYTLKDGDGGEEKAEESKHSAEDYSARSDDGSTKCSNDSGYVKEPPLIFVLRQLHLQHMVAGLVEEKNGVNDKGEEEMQDASVVALAPHEESNFNVPQHATEEFMQQHQVDDAPVWWGQMLRRRMSVLLTRCGSSRYATSWLK
jgi:hypothetical protein